MKSSFLSYFVGILHLHHSVGFITSSGNVVTRTKLMVSKEQDADPIVEIATNKDRRNFLNAIPATLIATGITGINFPSPAFASDELALSLYEDENTGFQIKRPAEWTQSEQKLPDRRRLVLFQNNDEKYVEKDLMFIAYTPVRDDFTQLSSFGSVEQVGQMTILPKG